ncbi:AAA family ATPase [Actinomadura syzygii]|uniref:AAA domain-containing protein n=1 Tax=Actinomadura syzygii TaxID=1427538 RepID=A0A5D0UM86_9ACTN|nr:MoxR family ATPase [Actinomadura syzygii]TYC18742.1 AAA domain-containing protein [Actinomadura syzygii]
MTAETAGTGLQTHHVYRGTGVPHDGIERLPPPPPWRDFGNAGTLGDGPRPPLHPPPEPVDVGTSLQRARSYKPDASVVDVVNAALILRRPLLVTGLPGTGKSTLAYSIAYELRLGPVLYWPITRSSVLRNGLYEYDAIGRLQETNIAASGGTRPADIGSFIRLGPLGTALLPARFPRVLLIDQLDQSDFDLPNELLSVMEEGEFQIPELMRIAGAEPAATVLTSDGRRVVVPDGRVRCHAFPMIVITSNGEREFPPGFLRRCLRLGIAPPGLAQLVDIVAAHLGPDMTARSGELIENFLRNRTRGDVGVDQLLNAIYLATSWDGPDARRLADALLMTTEADGDE